MFRVIALLLVFPLSLLRAQNAPSIAELEQKAQQSAQAMLHGKALEERQKMEAELKVSLEAIFRQPNAFAHEFAELKAVSVLASPDNAFKIFTWQFFINDSDYRYGGYVFTPNGKFFPLTDGSADMFKPETFAVGADRWYGALYYKIVPFETDGQKSYALLGFDAHSFYSRRKVFDVLTFSMNGKPLFGAPVIEARDALSRPVLVKRFLMEYSAEVSVRLNWDETLGLIVFDHLIQAGMTDEGPLNVPDGSYCGFKLHNGRWTYVEKIFDDAPILEDGQAPVPTPKAGGSGLFGPKN